MPGRSLEGAVLELPRCLSDGLDKGARLPLLLLELAHVGWLHSVGVIVLRQRAGWSRSPSGSSITDDGNLESSLNPALS